MPPIPPMPPRSDSHPAFNRSPGGAGARPWLSRRFSSPFSPWFSEAAHKAIEDALRRLAGLALFLLAFGTALALVSYAPQDPSFNSAASAALPVQNWLGLTGSYAADLLRQIFGPPVWLTPLLLIAWGISLWRRHLSAEEKLPLGLRALLALLGLLALACLMKLMGLKAGAPADLFIALLPTNAAVTAFTVAFFAALAGFTLYAAFGFSLAEWREFAALLAEKTVAAKETFFAWVHKLRLADADLSPAATPEPENGLAETAEESATPNEPDDTQEPRAARKRPRAKRPTENTPHKQPELALAGESALPPLDLLHAVQSQVRRDGSDELLERNAHVLESVLGDFGVRGAITRAQTGPVVTLYELEPAPGTKSSRIIALADDIARSMSAVSVRVAVVPGRNVIGIELPNAKRETVWLRELLETNEYTESVAKLPLVIGKDIGGAPIIADLARMPHLLVAGTTGSGKSVGINAMILSLLYRLPKEQCRLIMIDPKMLELSVYEGIPHLLAPVVTEPRKAIVALKWTVREMEDRYRAMSKLGVRNIEGYNAMVRQAREKGDVLTRRVQTGFDTETGKPVFEEQPLDLTDLPYIVVVVDEMADLMLVAGKEIEAAIQRLSQMARAAGIHLIMATQRPSVDVITGTIKANFPTRISFQVTSKIDSRTIIGEQGAEQLLGQGDMLFMAGGGRITRVHGPFVRDQEVEAVVGFLRRQGEPEYLEEVTIDEEEEKLFNPEEDGEGGRDELFDQAVDLAINKGRAATSMLQTHFSIGYNRAARIIQRMEDEGIISAPNHVGKREVLGRRREER